MHLDLSVRTWHRLDDGLTDDALGRHFVDLVRRAIDGGRAAAAVVVVRSDRFDLFELGPVLSEGLDVRMFVAALTRIEVDFAGPAEAVGVIGKFEARSGDGPAVPVGLVFLEWGDCRWWRWQAPLDPTTGHIRDDVSLISRATDGAARPGGLGGWWTLGRRAGVRGRLEPKEPIVVH